MNTLCYAVTHEKLGTELLMTFPKIIEYDIESQKKSALKPFYKAINCNLVEAISFHDKEKNIMLEFICDEEGAFVEGNPVYLVNLCIDGAEYNFNVVGDFVIAQSIEVNGDYRFVGFGSAEEIHKLLQQYEFNVLLTGFVK